MIRQTKEGWWIIDGDECIGKWIEDTGNLDADVNTIPHIAKLIGAGDVVVDGGAYVGDHTHAYLKAVGNSGRVYSFEPDPEAYGCLVRNCPGALSYQLALGTTYGRTAMQFVPDNPGASFIQSSGPRPIFIVPLDAMELPKLSLLKLDLEGCELKALLGALNTIKRCRPIIVIEIYEGALKRQGAKALDIFTLLTSIGYMYRNLHPAQPCEGVVFDIVCMPINVNV